VKTQATRPTCVRRGFTIIELSIVLIIIAVIASIAFVTFGRALQTGRVAGERLFISNIRVAVEQFKNDHGFLPPLVDDGINPNNGVRFTSPLEPTTMQPRIRDQAFLRGETLPNAARTSVFSLPFYLTGVLGAAQDGVEGLGMTAVAPDGSFARGGRAYDSYLDLGRDPARIRRNPNATLGTTEAVIVDRWGKNASISSWLPGGTIRYYRWEPRFGPPGSGTGLPRAPMVDANGIPVSAPKMVKALSDEMEMRNAAFAIVSKGPDGLLDEADPFSSLNADNIVEIGR